MGARGKADPGVPDGSGGEPAPQRVEGPWQVDTDVGAAQLAEQLAATVGAPAGSGPWELRSVVLGRAFRPEETLAEAGLWDGATLVLARSGEPIEARPRGGALAVAGAPTGLAVVPSTPPPVLAIPRVEQPRSMLPYVLIGLALLVLVGAGAGVWWLNNQSRGPAASVASAPPAAATVEALSTAASTPALAAAPQTEEAAWRDLLARLDLLWGDDWQATIALLQAFHTQYPTRVVATARAKA